MWSITFLQVKWQELHSSQIWGQVLPSTTKTIHRTCTDHLFQSTTMPLITKQEIYQPIKCMSIKRVLRPTLPINLLQAPCLKAALKPKKLKIPHRPFQIHNQANSKPIRPKHSIKKRKMILLHLISTKMSPFTWFSSSKMEADTKATNARGRGRVGVNTSTQREAITRESGKTI